MTYVLRVDYADGFEVIEVDAENYGEAVSIARRDPDAVSATVLGTIDREPQACLAFG